MSPPVNASLLVAWSLLLRGMIERGNKVAFPIFIEDIHANARGYELLYQSEVAANGQQ